MNTNDPYYPARPDPPFPDDLAVHPSELERPSAHRPANPQKTTTAAPAERHHRKCQICHHPEREVIEQEFIHWHYPYNIAQAYNIPGRALYRHAHADGLFARRQQNLRSVLDRILERNERATVTGDTIIRALRAYTCLTDDNKWVEPTSRVIFSSQALPTIPVVPDPIAQLPTSGELTVHASASPPPGSLTLPPGPPDATPPASKPVQSLAPPPEPLLIPAESPAASSPGPESERLEIDQSSPPLIDTVAIRK